MTYTEDEEYEEEEVTEEEEDEETEDSEEPVDEEEEGEGGGLLGRLGGVLGGAGLGAVAGGLVEQVTDRLKSGEGLNIGEMIDDATEEQGGIVKSVGDLVGGFLNRNKDNDEEE
jgi:hypothetical protein